MLDVVHLFIWISHSRELKSLSSRSMWLTKTNLQCENKTQRWTLWMPSGPWSTPMRKMFVKFLGIYQLWLFWQVKWNSTSKVYFYWIYFNILECKCSKIGSASPDCDPDTGRCKCKVGFSGEKCEICPDGSISNSSGCSTSNLTLKLKTISYSWVTILV